MRGLLLVVAVLCVAGRASAQGTCMGSGCVCDAAGCSCPGGCTLSCSGSQRCLFVSDGGDVTALCLPDSRCDLVLGARTDLTCTSRDRCRGEIGANSTVFCSGTGECSLGLGPGSTLDCYPDGLLGRCEPFCRGACLLRCTPSNGGGCRHFCADGGAPSRCGTTAFFGCEMGCALLDAGQDSGSSNAGQDGGVVDAGTSDAGQLDAGAFDAGPADGGQAGGGPDDAGQAGAGPTDGGPEPQPGNFRVGCGCGIGEAPFAAWLVMLGLRRCRASRVCGNTHGGA